MNRGASASGAARNPPPAIRAARIPYHTSRRPGAGSAATRRATRLAGRGAMGDTGSMPNRDAQRVIGVVLAAAMALSVQIAGIRTDVRRLEDRLNAMDDRLRAVEIAFAKVDQRLATLERLHLPAPDPAD